VLPRLLQECLQEAVAAVLPDADLSTVLVRPCPQPKFGDYQTNALMALAKVRRIDPRRLSAQVLQRLDVQRWCDRVEIAGAGFLNFRLKTTALAEAVRQASEKRQFFFAPATRTRSIIIDFSSPNVAKPMHIGHIRSTILGDCLARTLRVLGHRVITDNHIGDWGTQFGKLLVGWKRHLDADALKANPIEELERIYKTVNAACDRDPAVLESARQELVRLQQEDPQNLAIWREMIVLSQHQFDRVYARLGVTFDSTLGESFYNPQLKSIVQQLRERGLATESEGATVVFFADIPELKGQPAIVQKSDGAANYTTTDLATLDYRVRTWQPDEIIYVTDGRQQLHFNQLFAIFRRWHPEAKVNLAHVWFGSILGKDGKPFKTRAGDTVKLADLLDEAEERAFQLVSGKNPELRDCQRREIARVVGLGAVKYSDLLPNRQSDYVFDWDKMLALTGNTAPYLQYAYTRVRSILRKAEASGQQTPSAETAAPFVLSAATEITLAKQLLNFGLVLEAVAEDYRPNYLCNYLYDLAGHFARFYETCPVLKAEPRERSTRLTLCDLTGQVLKQGLNVLGIETTELM
jgi:arginyl-tRNA synthetase